MAFEIVLNKNYGFFSLPQEYADAKGYNIWDDSEEIRTDPDLIQWVKTHESETTLRVISVTNNLTDYYVNEHDGLETLIYVVNGKLHFNFF